MFQTKTLISSARHRPPYSYGTGCLKKWMGKYGKG